MALSYCRDYLVRCRVDVVPACIWVAHAIKLGKVIRSRLGGHLVGSDYLPVWIQQIRQGEHTKDWQLPKRESLHLRLPTLDKLPPGRGDDLLRNLPAPIFPYPKTLPGRAIHRHRWQLVPCQPAVLQAHGK